MARKGKFLTLLALMILGFASAEEAESQGHAHATSQTVQTSHSAGPSGTVTSVHSSSLNNGANDAAFATIANALADNPALAQAAAAALGGGGAAPGGGFAGLNAARYGALPGGQIGGGYPGGFPGGILGAFPGLGFGKGFNLNIDAGAGAGIGGLGGYFPIIEKAVVVVGGAILILLIIAFLQGTLSPGGFLHNLGGGFSKALAGAGSASVDVGPFHSGVSGAGSLGGGVNVGGASVNDPQFNNQVNNAINRRF